MAAMLSRSECVNDGMICQMNSRDKIRNIASIGVSEWYRIMKKGRCVGGSNTMNGMRNIISAKISCY